MPAPMTRRPREDGQPAPAESSPVQALAGAPALAGSKPGRKSAAGPLRIPRLRLHKASGQGYIEYRGRRKYLGRMDSPEDAAETQERYRLAVADLLRSGYLASTVADDFMVGELIAAFLEHADAHYRKPDGMRTSSYHDFIFSFGPLRELCSSMPVAEFGAKAIKAVRERMIQDKATGGRGWSRATANRSVRLIRHLFKWGTAEELVPPGILERLQAVTGLMPGRSKARETEPVLPVPEAHVEDVRARVSRPVRAMIDLQLLTGARPGEVCKLRAIDIDTSGKVWLANIAEHKTAYKGRRRMLYLGPQAQNLVRSFMETARRTDAPLFSPREAFAESAVKHGEKRAERDGRELQRRREDQKPNPRKTARVIGDAYTTNTYARAIRDACRKADIPAWGPNRLRHNYATNVRKRYGLEAAQVLLGHAACDVTQVYAERDSARALEIAAAIG